MAGDVRRPNVYDKKSQRYAKNNRTSFNCIRSDKSVAYVTNNKRLRSTFCIIEVNYWQTRSIAGLFATAAELLVILATAFVAGKYGRKAHIEWGPQMKWDENDPVSSVYNEASGSSYSGCCCCWSWCWCGAQLCRHWPSVRLVGDRRWRSLVSATDAWLRRRRINYCIHCSPELSMLDVALYSQTAVQSIAGINVTKRRVSLFVDR